MLFNLFGTQLAIGGRQETFQTAGGMRRAAHRAGLEVQHLKMGKHFVMSGKKNSAR
jgi:hypothetical protein